MIDKLGSELTYSSNAIMGNVTEAGTAKGVNEVLVIIYVNGTSATVIKAVSPYGFVWQIRVTT